ncbi:glycerophosphoryl diester phosphodiesterase membrane domain-containing protein, partial [Clostridium tarantellae]
MYKKLFKDFKYLFTYNLSTLIIFELFHKGIAVLAIVPFINLLINLAIKKEGLAYLFSQNLIKLITNPISIILILTAVILLVFYIFFEITAVVICIEEGRKDNKINFFKLILLSFKKALLVLNPKNILLFIMILIIIPLTNLNFTSGLLMKLKIPEYVLHYINSNKLLNIIYISVFLLIYILMNRWIFSIYQVILETTSFNLAIRKSLKATKKKLIKIILYSIILFVTTYLVGITVYYIGIVFIALFSKYI